MRIANGVRIANLFCPLPTMCMCIPRWAHSKHVLIIFFHLIWYNATIRQYPHTQRQIAGRDIYDIASVWCLIGMVIMNDSRGAFAGATSWKSIEIRKWRKANGNEERATNNDKVFFIFIILFTVHFVLFYFIYEIRAEQPKVEHWTQHRYCIGPRVKVWRQAFMPIRECMEMSLVCSHHTVVHISIQCQMILIISDWAYKWLFTIAINGRLVSLEGERNS